MRDLAIADSSDSSGEGPIAGPPAAAAGRRKRGSRPPAPPARRIATLREFARHVIVNEFAGDVPAPRILDALVAYMDQFEFLPNPKIDRLGRLTGAADAAAKRSQALFVKPFAAMDNKSCASCHAPDALFTDGRRHDIGSDGVFDTPSLLNSRFTAPYFHDGRLAELGDVVEHFDRTFALGLKPRGKSDLTAYLLAVGDAADPFGPVTRQSEMSEIAAYVGVLDQATDARDLPATALVVDTVNFDLELIARRFDNRNPRTGKPRRPDRSDVAAIAAKLIEDMTAVGTLARAGQTAKAKKRSTPTATAPTRRSARTPMARRSTSARFTRPPRGR